MFSSLHVSVSFAFPFLRQSTCAANDTAYNLGRTVPFVFLFLFSLPHSLHPRLTMSIFSSLKKSRQQAKDHKSKVAEQKKKEDVNAPYKHVPTHAASDAFASAPPSYREDDRPRIVEQNRRRSAMAASGHHMNMPGVPRVGSSLSHVTYPGHEAHPVPPLPRAYSYAGVSPYAGGSRENRDPAMSAPDMAYFNQTSLKGKEVPRTFAGETQAFSKSACLPVVLDLSSAHLTNLSCHL